MSPESVSDRKRCTIHFVFGKEKIQFNIYTKNAQAVQNLFTVQSKNGLKLEMYGFCTYKQCTNYTKPIPLKRLCMFFVHRNNIKTKQNLYNELTEMAFLSLLYIQTMYKLYKINTNLN